LIFSLIDFFIDRAPLNSYITDFGQMITAIIALIIHRLSKKISFSALLYFYEEFTYKEISETFGLRSVKSARKLLHRALDKLSSLNRL
jgi:hypothetical protein